LIKIGLSDDRITTLVEDVKLPTELFVITFGDKIFQTNYVNNSGTCYTINGEKLWEFNDESVLGQPVGVDGKQWRQLLDHNDGMSCPYGISIDRTTNNILISNYIASALMYHIS
jgi:hypothetical protein